MSEYLGEIWQYRELFYFLIWRDVKVRYKQTILGAAWAVIQPFCTMVVFTLFFRKMANMPSDGIPYPIFTYSALIPWTYLSQAITNSGNSLVASSNLFTKVYFPRVAIPASSAFSGLVDFAIAGSVLLVMMVYYDFAPSWSLLMWPVLLVPLVMLALGVGMIFAALNVKYRDVRYALPFVTQIWLFTTPIIYPTSIIPERFRTLLALNPLVGLIDAFRASLFTGRVLDWQLFTISIVMTTVIFVAGNIYFRKVERVFADIV